jgi:hypothetical protein
MHAYTYKVPIAIGIAVETSTAANLYVIFDVEYKCNFIYNYNL